MAEEIQHAAREHAILSASGAHRWMNCTPSARIEAELPDKARDAALQGTAAHELAEAKLYDALMTDHEVPESEWQDAEMQKATDDYRDFVVSRAKELEKQTGEASMILVEQRLDFSPWVPEGFGTGDALILCGNTVEVIDLKYGAGIEVSAIGNPQMRCYALGAVNVFENLWDFETINMTIFQPRRDNYSTDTMTITELMDWADEELAPAAQLAFKGAGEFSAGEWCQFCKIKATCKARAEKNLEIAQYEFDEPVELTKAEIADILVQAPMVKAWLNDVEKYALSASLNQGEKWPGMKLVAGRAIRKYVDPKKVAETVEKAGYADIYEKKLLPLSQMEKLLGKKEFNELVGNLIHKPAGKPTLVPISDRRPEIQTSSVEDDFSEL